MLDQVLGLCGEADPNRPHVGWQRSSHRQEVGIGHQAQLERMLAALYFLPRLGGDFEVGDRGGHDQRVEPGVVLGERRQHLLGRAHVDDFNPGRFAQRSRCGDQDHVRTPIAGRLGDGVAHLARRVVADVADGVDRLQCPASCYEHAFAGQVATGAEGGADDIHDGFRGGQAAEPDQATGQVTLFRLHDPDAAGAQHSNVGRGRGMRIHARVHGWRDDDRAARRQDSDGDRIVGQAMRQLGQGVGCRRRHDDHLALAAERDVGDVGLHPWCPEIGEHRSMRDRLKRQRLDEALRVGGHRHVDDGAGLVQRTGQTDCLERGNAAGDAEGHPFASQHAHHGYRLVHGFRRCARGRAVSP